MTSDPHNPRKCINREPHIPERKRRFSGCGVIDIDPTVVKTWFRVESNARASAKQMLLNHTCMRIEVTRKGQQYAFAAYNAFSTDNGGNVSFYWDAAFLSQPPGFYLGDVFFNDEYCFSMGFRIRRCEAEVTECRNEHESLCQTGSSDVIGSQGTTTCEDKPCIPQEVINTTPPLIQGDCDPLPLADCGPDGCGGGIGLGSAGPDTIGVDDE